MGNKLTLSLIFFGFVLSAQIGWGQNACSGTGPYPVDCENTGNTTNATPDVSTICDPYSIGSIKHKGDPKFETVVCTCKFPTEYDNTPQAYFVDPRFYSTAAASHADFCPKQAPVAQTQKYCNAPNSSGPKKVDGRDNLCQCNLPEPGTNEHLVYDAADNQTDLPGDPNPCPAPVAATNTENDCLKNLEDSIKSCTTAANLAVQQCDEKSEKNAGIKNTIGGLANQATAALQNNAANSGSIDKCRQAGFASNAAGYGLGQISASCKEEMGNCDKSCSSLTQYSDIEKIRAKCSSQFAPQTNEMQAAYEARIKPLNDRATAIADSMSTVIGQCAGPDKDQTTAGKLSNTLGNAVNSYAAASKSAFECEQAVASEKLAAPINFAQCFVAVGGVLPAGCPTNCISNPSDASCKSYGGNNVSTVGGGKLPSLYKPIDISGGKIGGSSTGGVGLGNLDVSDNSVVPPTLPPKDEGSGSMFGSSQGANAGSAGATGPGAAGKEKGAAADPAAEGGVAGAFQAMKRAAGNLFSGGSSFFSKKDTSESNKKSVTSSATKNSMIRGLANASGAKCFVDSAGSQYCFGRASKDIFKQMSEQIQYQYQNNKFIKD